MDNPVENLMLTGLPLPSPGDPHRANFACRRGRSRTVILEEAALCQRPMLHCVNWSWVEDVETRTVCMTEDGVLLRFLIDDKPVSEARSVSYRPQPADLFQVPPGYTPLLAPEGGPVP